MTTLDLQMTFIAPVSDLSAAVIVPQYDEKPRNGSNAGVRTYAGGRRRVVSRPGETLEISVAYRFITRAEYASLLDLVGELVLFRDQRGRQVFGLLGDIDGDETDSSQPTLVADVSFTITEVTYSEIV